MRATKMVTMSGDRDAVTFTMRFHNVPISRWPFRTDGTNNEHLPENTCPRCSNTQRRSPGESCRYCGIDSWDYGPRFCGYEMRDGKRVRIEPFTVTF